MKNFCKQIDNFDAAVFSVFNQDFLFSASTVTYFPITKCAKDILLSDYFISNKISDFIISKYSSDEISLTCKKLDEFKSNNVLSKRRKYDKNSILYTDFFLKLVGSTKCNLRCNYCFANKSAEYDMSFDTAKKAILFFLDKFVPDEKRRVVIDLTGAGEPLVRLDFILKVNNFVQELKRQRNINIFCQFATNGMLLTKEVSKLLKENNILYGVSLDGNKIASEQNRLGLDYDLVSKNIVDIENKQFFGLASTYSANNHNFVEIFKTLYSFNPEVVGMKPVRLLESNPNSINKNNINEIKKSYDDFVKWLYKQLVSGDKKIFDTFMHSEDFLSRYMKTVLRPFRVFYRCSSGINSFAVDGKENIIICPAFVGEKDGIIGNLDSGIFEENKKHLESLYADNISFCKNCWARYTCAGECFSVGYMNHGIFEKPSSTMCELKKYLIQLSIYFWTCLKYEHQDLYNECLEKY